MPREDFDEVLEKLRILTDENAQMKFKMEGMENQVLRSKQQVISLMNDLYSIEKSSYE